MAYTTINKPNTQMNTVLYTGNGGTQSITGVGFQPDWTWLKARSESASHELFDVVRGVTKTINSNTNNAEATQTDSLTAFGSDGFTLGSNGDINYNNSTYVGWNWKAGGTASTNTDGSIDSQVSVNTDAGFSIVKYTAPSGVSTIGHGLGVVPNVIMLKVLDEAGGWFFGMPQLNGWQNRMILNTTGSSTTETRAFYANGSAPTNTVWSTDQNSMGSPGDVVAYCFADKAGFSKFGSYIGNGQDTPNGVFTYLGFTPAFILIKATDINSWVMVDNKRPADSNPVDDSLAADSTAAETTGNTDTSFDFLSNGFRTNGNSGNNNSSGQEYIYMAFAEHPLVGTNNVPATAR